MIHVVFGVDRIPATVNDRLEWSCRDSELQAMLQSRTAVFADGRGPADGNPQRFIAAKMCELFRGTVVADDAPVQSGKVF